MEEIYMISPMTKCTYVYVESIDECKDSFNDCEITLGNDALCIKENDVYHWYYKNHLKYFQFIRKED